MSLCPKCQNSVRKGAKFCRWSEEERKRVGVFVDYENFTNIVWLCRSGMSVKEMGEVLSDYAELYGDVVCRWICVHPHNVPHWYRIHKPDLTQVGFSIKYPDGVGVLTGELNHSHPQQVDHALIQLIDEESRLSQPEIYVIVSGDVDYYTRIEELIDQGHSVHLWASKSDRHLAGKYYELEKNYRPGLCAEAGQGNFIIDDLDMIFRSQEVCPFRRLIKCDKGLAGLGSTINRDPTVVPRFIAGNSLS